MKFAYWSREIAGWALIAIALYTFWSAYGLLLDHRVFDGGPILVMAFLIFRGGIHVLKVAVAAQAARSLPDAAKPAKSAVRRSLPTRIVGPTAPKTVLPGPRSRTKSAR